MDNLFCGNLFPPPFSGGQIGRRFVQRRFVKTVLELGSGERDHHSGIGRFLIAISPEQRSPSARNPDRHHPGIVIAIIPEQRSPSPGIRSFFSAPDAGHHPGP